MTTRRRRAAPGKRRLTYPDGRPPVDHWNEDKEQISLAPGSKEYEEYVRDRLGVDEENFVQDDARMDVGDERRPDDVRDAPAESEHTSSLAGELGAAAQAQRLADAETARRKYRRQMSKVTQRGALVNVARAMAAETPGTEDDARVERMAGTCAMSLPEVQNDGVGQDDYIPRSLERYL